ncbi:MAG: YfiR family protein [Verrucomicrobiota bacterium]|nr:YfiR family protein [Verrucomicrobiota bacterium]
MALRAGAIQAQQSAPADYQVKAAFLINFARFIDWAGAGFTNAQSPLVIGVYGGAPFHGWLGRYAGAQSIAGHSVEVRHLSSLSQLGGCQIVYIAAPEAWQRKDAIAAAAGSPVLTVGDAADFCDSGGMIQFVIQNNRVHFAINNSAARRAGLAISSQLLALARRVKK